MSKKKESKFARYWFYDINKILGWPGFMLTLRPKRYYISKEAKKHVKGRAIVVANHNTFTDAFHMHFSLPYRRHHIIGAKEVLEANKTFDWLTRKLLTYKIDRDKVSLSSIKTIMNLLKEERVVDIFAEGQVFTDTNEIADFKTGATYFAYKTNSPIIPIYIIPRKSVWNRLKFAIGEPIDLQKLGFDSKDKLDEASNYVRDKLIELKNTFEKKEK